MADEVDSRRPTLAEQLGLEKRSIDYIPPSERHGRPNTLLTFWAATNVTLVAAVTGALAVAIGLDLPWAIATIVIGNLVGARRSWPITPFKGQGSECHR